MNGGFDPGIISTSFTGVRQGLVGFCFCKGRGICKLGSILPYAGVEQSSSFMKHG